MTGAEIPVAAAVAPELAAGIGAAAFGGGTASLFGAGAPTLASGLLTAEAAAPVVGMGGGTASLFGPATAGVSPLAASMANVAPQAAGLSLKPMEFGMKAASNMMGQQQQSQGGAMRPPQTAQAESMQRIMEERLKRGMGGRSDWAGLLGAAIGR